MNAGDAFEKKIENKKSAREESKKIGYTLKRSDRAKTMRLAIYPDGNVVVTAPRLFGFEAIERFVAKHASWITRHVDKRRGRSILRIRKAEIPLLKKRALALVEERCAHFAPSYAVRYGQISVRAQKSRWGSCSSNGNLSFNYKIALLPPRIADYIVVHELCHLREMNHSKDFWAYVECAFPDYKTLRKELRNTVSIYY
jgi:predicted metal-dependent hydrolase